VFKDIHIPVVSINARLWPTEPEENRKYIKDYQLFYIEGTGHFPMLEKPEEFNMLLRKAINSIEAKSNNQRALLQSPIFVYCPQPLIGDCL